MRAQETPPLGSISPAHTSDFFDSDDTLSIGKRLCFHYQASFYANDMLPSGSSQAVASASEEEEDLYGSTPPNEIQNTSPPPASLPSGTSFQPDEVDGVSPAAQSTTSSESTQSPSPSLTTEENYLYDSTPPEMRGRTGFDPPRPDSAASQRTVIPEETASSRRRSSQIGPLDTSHNARPTESTGLFGLPESVLERLAHGSVPHASKNEGEAEVMDSALKKFAHRPYQGPQGGPSGLSEQQRRQDSQAEVEQEERVEDGAKEVHKGEGKDEEVAEEKSEV